MRGARSVRRGGSVAAVVGLLGLLVVALVGCQAQLDAAGELGDTQLIVGRDPTGLSLESPEWRSPQTIVYLCPTAPTKTFATLADAGTVSLSADCRSYGKLDTTQGLHATLGFGALDATRRQRFEAAPAWYVVLIGVRDGGVDRVYRTAVKPIAIDPGITPGPADPASPSAAVPTAAGPSAAAL